MYASPEWWGYASIQNKDEIEVLINRMKLRGLLHPEHTSADGLAVKADKCIISGHLHEPEPRPLLIVSYLALNSIGINA